MSVIISNTTPINYLVLIDHIAVLHHLYARIIVPQAVFGELQDEGTPAKVKAWVISYPAWMWANAKRSAWPQSLRQMPSSSTNQRGARQRDDRDYE
jgi:hypothetical protein